MRRGVPVVLLFGLLVAGCGASDPLEPVKQDFPGAEEYLSWARYVLIRFPADKDDPGRQEAVLLKKDGEKWRELARSDIGFNRAREVMTWIPELDEDGVAAFGLHH